MKGTQRIRFALLCRVSTRGQLAGVSLDVQKSRGMEYVRLAGGTVVETYAFQESGRKSLDERTQFNRVMRDAGSKSWDALWVMDQSRLARSTKDMCHLIEFLVHHGLELHTSAGKLPMATPAGKFMLQMLSSASELETDTSKWKTLESRERLMKEGKHAFGKWPYGRILQADKKTWKVDPAARRLIERAYRLYVHGGKSLADTALLVGVKKTTLRKRLQSACVSEWRRKLTTADGEQWFTIHIPALLTKQQGREIERRATSNRTVLPAAGRRRSLLQGLLLCSKCNRAMTRMPNHKGKGKRKTTTYVYRHPRLADGTRCFWHVPADLIEHSLLKACAEVIEDNKKLKSAIEKALRNASSRSAEAKDEAREVLRSLTAARQVLHRVIDELTARPQPGPARQRLLQKMHIAEQKVLVLEETYATTQSEAAAEIVSPQKAAEIARKLRTLCGISGSVPLFAMGYDQQRLLVALVVGRTRRDSDQGIFVRQERFGQKKKQIYWEWELRGAIADVDGTASRYEAFSYANDIKRIEFDNSATALQLAHLAERIEPVRWRSSTLCSSDD